MKPSFIRTTATSWLHLWYQNGFALANMLNRIRIWKRCTWTLFAVRYASVELRNWTVSTIVLFDSWNQLWKSFRKCESNGWEWIVNGQFGVDLVRFDNHLLIKRSTSMTIIPISIWFKTTIWYGLRCCVNKIQQKRTFENASTNKIAKT